MKSGPTIAAALGCLAAGLALAGGSGVEGTRHNLSVTGPGPVKAAAEDRICVFCHAAHVPAGPGPLWNHQTSGVVDYLPYSSPLMGSTPAGVDGASRLCLSCHDGTIAVGAVRGASGPLQMLRTDAAGRLRADAPSNLGVDLSGAHPVSVDHRTAMRRRSRNARTTLLDPRGLARFRGAPLLDPRGRVQCTSCHDPHVDPAATGANVPPFWKGDTFSEVCVACHAAPLADDGHADPTLLPGECGSCHVGHGEPGEALLAHREEGNCLTCHGSPADRRSAIETGALSQRARPARIDDLIARPYAHPVLVSTGEHRLGEDLRATRFGGARARRHVECADCHPAHATRNAPQPSIGRPNGPARATLDGQPEHEICFDCHGSAANLPFGATDKIREFDPANASFHPVVAPARQRSASLTGPWLSGDVLTCSDCHGADGDDPRRGPHGSRNPFLLRGGYVVRDGSPEAIAAYEACYDCHGRGAVLSDDTFAGHSQHVVAGQISCYACHDSHGSRDYPALIRFNKDPRNGTVAPSSSGRLEYDPGSGVCYLSCHGVDHDPLGYLR